MSAYEARKGNGRAQPWGDDPLGYLIAPNGAEDFFDRIYEREPLVVTREDRERFSPLLSIESIDELLAGVDLREGSVDVTDATREIPRDVYVSSEGYVDRGVIAHQHRQGATIIVQQLHAWDPTLADFCRALESVFSCHVQTNIYVTPPNAQGFKTHYDNHDVFVLQIAGEKRWRLYDRPVDTPFRGEQFQSGRHKPGAVSHEFVLKAGDVAYVPRGLMHDADTSGDETSLHITTGLIVRTWADLMLEAVSEVALNDPAFRTALPPGYAGRGFDRTKAQEHFRKLARSIGEKAQMDASFDLSVDNFIRSRAPNTRGAITDVSRPIGDGDRFRARKFVPWRLAEDGDKLVLIAAGGDVDFDHEDRATLERVLEGEAFGLGDLGRDDAEDVVRRLQAFGLVERVSA